MVAPVRETCAQTLGVVLKHMNETGVHKTVDVLLKLLTQEQWEVRHGGLLGIKYALAVRQVITLMTNRALEQKALLKVEGVAEQYIGMIKQAWVIRCDCIFILSAEICKCIANLYCCNLVSYLHKTL